MSEPTPIEGGTGPHLDDRLSDYVLGRLDAAQLLQIQRHLKTCDACRADVEFATTLRDRETAPGHLAPERLVGFADGILELDAAESIHLDRCGDCAREVEAIRAIPMPQGMTGGAPSEKPAAARGTLPAPARRSSSLRGRTPQARQRRQLISTASALAIAATIIFMLVPRGLDLDRLASLAQLEALEVRITRTTDARNLGYGAYREGRLEDAVESLRSVADGDGSGAEVQLYLASALARLDRDDEAIGVVDEALARDDASAGVTDELRWLRVQLALRAGDAPLARDLLVELEQSGGRRAEDARALLARLKARR